MLVDGFSQVALQVVTRQPEALGHRRLAVCHQPGQSWGRDRQQDGVCSVRFAPDNGHIHSGVSVSGQGPDGRARADRDAGLGEGPTPYRHEAGVAIWRLGVPKERPAGPAQQLRAVAAHAVKELPHGHSQRACHATKCGRLQPVLATLAEVVRLHELRNGLAVVAASSRQVVRVGAA